MPSEVAGGIHVDDELLALAAETLRSEDFQVAQTEQDGLMSVIAENHYFIVSVLAASTVDQLLQSEEAVVTSLIRRMKEAELGPKIWDAYVILLTQELMVDSGEHTEEIFALNYDTMSVRRIAHAGVSPTMADVRRALAPFVRPVELDDESVSEDPAGEFIAALIDRGVSSDLANQAVSVHMRGGKIDDVI